jgi:hypothetical protein
MTVILSLLASLSFAAAAPTRAEEPAAAPNPTPPPWDWTRLTEPLELSGYAWVDTGYMERTNAQPGQFDQDANYMQGRFVLRAKYRRTLGTRHFAEARLEVAGLVNEFVGGQYAEPHILDSYVAVGRQDRWAILLGRFLAWEVYYRGQGIELYTAEEAGALDAPALYWLDRTRGHENGPGQAAVQVHPFTFLGIQVAGVYGQENQQNHLGYRPAAYLHLGGLKIIGGYEYREQKPQTDADKVETTWEGWAGRVQYSFTGAGSAWRRAPPWVTFSEEVGRGWTGPVATFGVEAAQLSVEAVDIQGLVNAEATLDKTTYGAFVDLDFWDSSIGLGYHRTEQENEQREENTHDQAFVSYLYRLPIRGLSVKAVYGFARGHIEDVDTGTSWRNDVNSFRVRVRYDFV